MNALDSRGMKRLNTFVALVALSSILAGVVAPQVCDADTTVSEDPMPKTIPAVILQNLHAGNAQEMLVQFVADDIDRLATQMREAMGLKFENQDIRFERRQSYLATKTRVLSTFDESDVLLLRDYEELPMAFIRVSNESSLKRLLNDVEVKAVYENKKFNLLHGQGLPLSE